MLRSHDGDVDADDNDDDDYGVVIIVMTVKKNSTVRPSKKICPKCMLLGTSGVIWGYLGTFWSDFSDFRMQNHSVFVNTRSKYRIWRI